MPRTSIIERFAPEQTRVFRLGQQLVRLTNTSRKNSCRMKIELSDQGEDIYEVAFRNGEWIRLAADN